MNGPTQAQFPPVLRFLLPIALAAFLAWPIFLPDTAQEDALITARFARNIAQGHGVVYNVGEKVLGTTTLGWVLLQSLAFLIPAPDHVFVMLGQMMSCAFLVAAILVVASTPWAESWKIRAVAAAGLAMHPMLEHAARAGMETGALAFCAALLWRSLWFKPPSKSEFIKRVVLVCLIVFLRLDSVFLIVALYAAPLIVPVEEPADRKRFFKESVWTAICATLFVAALLGCCYLIYGQALPQSVVSKARMVSEVSVAKFVANLAQLAGTDFPWPRILTRAAMPVWALLWLSALVYGLLSTNLPIKARSLLVASTIYLVTYAAFFTQGGAGIYPWYTHAPIFLFELAVLSGLLLQIRRPASMVLLGMIATGLSAILFISVYSLAKKPRQETLLHRIGTDLKSWQANSVMLEPIGYIGFYSGAHVCDLGGLVSMEIYPLRKARQPGWFVEAAQKCSPQYVVLRHNEIEKNLGWNVGVLFGSQAQRDWWSAHYRLREVVDMPGDPGFDIFQTYK